MAAQRDAIIWDTTQLGKPNLAPVEKRRPGRPATPIERADEHLKC